MASPYVPATYIFDTLQGTIEGYSRRRHPSPTRPRSWSITARTRGGVHRPGRRQTSDGQDYIYAANEGTNPGIQVFNGSFQQVTQFGTKKNPVVNPFIDPDLPAGFVPYGVRDLSLGTHQAVMICSSPIEAPTSRVGRLPCSPTTARF